MNFIIKHIKNLLDKEFIRFLIAGFSTLFIDYGGLIFLTEYVNLHYLLSATISFTLAVIINYYICLKWVFTKSKKQTLVQFILFIITSIIGLLLNLITMKVMVEYFEIYYIIAKIVSTIIVTLWNYITKKMTIERY